MKLERHQGPDVQGLKSHYDYFYSDVLEITIIL